MPDDTEITKSAPTDADGYFRDNHPMRQIYIVDRAEAARAMAQRFLAYKEQLAASKGKRK